MITNDVTPGKKLQARDQWLVTRLTEQAGQRRVDIPVACIRGAGIFGRVHGGAAVAAAAAVQAPCPDHRRMDSMGSQRKSLPSDPLRSFSPAT
jgi:hypothetical protein